MQSVKFSINTSSFVCDDLVLPHGSLRPADLFDQKSNFPHFVFTQTGSIICAYSPSRLHCQFACGREFSWTPSNANVLLSSLENWPTDAPQTWRIVEAAFLPSSPTMVVLLSPPNDTKPKRSLICLLDLNDGQTVKFCRFISLRGMAESIHVATVDRKSIPSFDGVIAVAFERGLLALLDICLDWKPYKLYLEPSVCVSVEQCLDSFSKEEALSPFSELYEHSIVNLNASRISLNSFYYDTPRGDTLVKFPSASVRITLLHYIPQIRGLVVGFNFGGWQLWSITKLQLLFTYRELPSPPVATVKCAFSEPSDDPRYCCYLFIGWQAPQRPNCRSSSLSVNLLSPKVCLFQLGFRRRIERTQPRTEDTLYEYEDFYGASRRLSASLNPIANPMGNQAAVSAALITSIQSLATNYSSNYGLRSNRLTALVWRAAPHIVRLGFFDLDRWYQAQMPSTIRSENSFFAVYDASLDSPQVHPLTAYVLPHTIFAFWADAYRRGLFALKLCSGMAVTNRSSIPGYQDLRKPLPESQLRPSTHAFKAIVPFIRSLFISCASLEFVSRQELMLRDIAGAIASSDSQVNFNPVRWITEAVACGLIQEFDDSDFDIPRSLKEAENSDWIIRQAIGLENLPQNFLKQLEVMDVQEEEERAEYLESIFTVASPNSDKKRGILLAWDGGKPPKGRRKSQPKTAKYLSPTWVIVANCLFEYGMFKEVKMLRNLICNVSKVSVNEDFDASAFMRRWLWLRWLGRKSYLEQLLSPLFSDASTVGVNGLKDLSQCIQSVRALVDIAETVMSPDFIDDGDDDEEAISAEAKLKVMRMLAGYTRPLCLLLRLGLLPEGSDLDDRSRTQSESLLSPYNATEISDFLAKLHSSCGAPPPPPFITDRIMEHLRYLSTTDLCVDATAAEVELAIEYPPRRLQSVCALFQCVERKAGLSPTHLAFLVFLLFDVVAVNAMRGSGKEKNYGRGNDGIEDQETHAARRVRLATAVETERVKKSTPVGAVARAFRLQQIVVNQVVSEFPDFKKYISTVRILWLVDRFRFSEVLCSRLSPVSTGQVNSLSCLPEIFPKQAGLVADHCARYGQTELVALFTPHFDFSLDSSLPLLRDDDIWARGTVLPALYHARRLYSRQKDSEAAAKVLLEVAEKFRNNGRFLDLINLGLTSWEADVIFSDMRRKGDINFLFACLIARAQYKEAHDLLTEADSDTIARLSHRPLQRISTTPIIRAMNSTMSACLPNLQHLFPFSSLISSNHSQDPPSNNPNFTEEASINGDPVVCVEMEPTYSTPQHSVGRLPRHFVTPKGCHLSVRPSTIDRNRASEFWNYYDISERVLRGENPFKSKSPVKPRITDSARKLSRKLRQTLYCSSVVSPVFVPRKKTALASRDLLDAHSITSERSSLRLRSDFWSDLGRVHEEELRKSNQAPPVATPTVSILKVRSAHPVESQNTPPLVSTTKNTAESEVSAQGCQESIHSIEVDDDDLEVTINPRTLVLDRTVSLAEVNAENPVNNESTSLMSSPSISNPFVFSPPHRSTFGRPGHMDEVAEALCSATHFAFSSPASYLMAKFQPSRLSTHSPMVDLEEEDEEGEDDSVSGSSSFDHSRKFNRNSDIEGISAVESQDVAETGGDDDACESAVVPEASDNDADAERTKFTAVDDEVSTQSEIGESEHEKSGLQTTRRSKRNVKRPDRYPH